MKKLLVVDDEEDMVWTLQKNLRNSELDVDILAAHSGEEALEILKEAPVDLVVTDIRMPGISGLDLLLTVKQDYPETGVIVMTAFETPDLESRLRKLGVIRCLSKPLDLDELTETILCALQERQLAEAVPATPLQLQPEPVTE